MIVSIILPFFMACLSSIHANMQIGACYDPFHTQEAKTGNVQASIEADFQLMQNKVASIRTFFATVRGVDLIPMAKKYNVPIYVGILNSGDTNQLNTIIKNLKEDPATIPFVKGILLGSENIGAVSPQQLTSQINQFRQRLANEVNAAAHIPIGTAQRVGVFLKGNVPPPPDVIELAKASDLIGINIYPFFDRQYSEKDPIALMNSIWSAVAYTPAYKGMTSKFIVTETGFPSAGAPNLAGVASSLEREIGYYNALVNFKPNPPMNQPIFWFSFFDRTPDDNSFREEYERHFGWYTFDRKLKSPQFPTDGKAAPAGVPVVNPANAVAAPVPSTTDVAASKCALRKKAVPAITA